MSERRPPQFRSSEQVNSSPQDNSVAGRLAEARQAFDRIRYGAHRRLTDAELTAQHAGYHDFNAIELMVIEIRERRAADLNLFEREALEEMSAACCTGSHKCPHALGHRTVDRLLSRGGGG
jgi:hypothetical protein